MFMKKLTVPALIVMLATAIPTSCKKNEVLVPPVELEDQIMYNENEPVEIRSAIYEAEENGMTTFYLSPTQGISDVKGMTVANDYLMLSVLNADGEVDGAFELSYHASRQSRKPFLSIMNTLWTMRGWPYQVFWNGMTIKRRL